MIFMNYSCILENSYTGKKKKFLKYPPGQSKIYMQITFCKFVDKNKRLPEI